MSWRNRIAAQPQVVQAPSDGPARFRNHDAERTIDKIVVQFEHGKWDDSAAQAVLQYVKKDDTLNWRVDRVVICQKPWGRKACWHTLGRPGDPNADPHEHVTFHPYCENRHCGTKHVRRDGYGTNYKPNLFEVGIAHRTPGYQSQGNLRSQNRTQNRTQNQSQTGGQVNFGALNLNAYSETNRGGPINRSAARQSQQRNGNGVNNFGTPNLGAYNQTTRQGLHNEGNPSAVQLNPNRIEQPWRQGQSALATVVEDDEEATLPIPQPQVPGRKYAHSMLRKPTGN